MYRVPIFTKSNYRSLQTWQLCYDNSWHSCSSVCLILTPMFRTKSGRGGGEAMRNYLCSIRQQVFPPPPGKIAADEKLSTKLQPMKSWAQNCKTMKNTHNWGQANLHVNADEETSSSTDCEEKVLTVMGIMFAHRYILNLAMGTKSTPVQINSSFWKKNLHTSTDQF